MSATLRARGLSPMVPGAYGTKPFPMSFTGSTIHAFHLLLAGPHISYKRAWDFMPPRELIVTRLHSTEIPEPRSSRALKDALLTIARSVLPRFPDRCSNRTIGLGPRDRHAAISIAPSAPQTEDFRFLEKIVAKARSNFWNTTASPQKCFGRLDGGAPS